MGKIKMILLAIGISLGIGLVIPTYADAVVVGDICAIDEDSALCNESESKDLISYVKNIINTLLFILGVLSVVMIIYAGITYTTSAGDAKKTEKAKATILYSIIGLVIALLAGTIVNFVITELIK